MKFIEHRERLEVKFTKNTDAIVVLSSGNRKARRKIKVLEWHDPDRFFAGIALLRESAPQLIFTGGATPYNPKIHLKYLYRRRYSIWIAKK